MHTAILMAVLMLTVLAGCGKPDNAGPSAAKPPLNKAVPPPHPNFAGLIEEYRAILKADPDNLAGMIGLGNAYSESGQWKEAIMMYDHVLLIDPRNADVRTDRGNAYRNIGMADRALAEYRAALAYEPANVEARYSLGILYSHDKKDCASAVRVWEEMLQIAPNSPHAQDVRSGIEACRKTLKKRGE